MKRFKIYAFGTIILLFFLTFFLSCSKGTKDGSIIVTIDPQKYFLSQIIGDKYKIDVLIGSGSNPESYDPTPSQMMAIENSVAYFKLGYLNFENILLDKIQKSKDLHIFDCSKGVDIIGTHHDCSEHIQTEIITGHDYGDPHYWSSITSAKVILKNMLDGMCEIDSVNSVFYKENYDKAIKKLLKLENEVVEILDKSQSKSFVIYHPALSYYAKEFGLTQLSIEQNGKMPSPNNLKKIIDEAIKDNAKVVFIQKEFDIKNGEIVAKQIGAKTYSINLLDYKWDDVILNISKQIAGEK